MSEETGDRIESIERELSFQAAGQQDLSSLVIDCGKRIERLEEQMRQVLERLRDMAEPGSELPKSERPPHY
ncbi:MAG TPA: SlyX family protein [Rectinemataceae bacterium]|nr:SlyX family protein [Rectinemataceae bacterium]